MGISWYSLRSIILVIVKPELKPPQELWNEGSNILLGQTRGKQIYFDFTMDFMMPLLVREFFSLKDTCKGKFSLAGTNANMCKL